MVCLWFVSAPLYGHLDWGGFLATAQALHSRGHTVRWLSEAPMAPAVQGLPFTPITQTGWLWPLPPLPDVRQIPPAEAVMLRYRRALDTWLTEDLVLQGTKVLIELTQTLGRPDAIVTDPFLSAAGLAAEALDVPLIVAGWPAFADLNAEQLYPVQVALAADSRGRLQRLLDQFGLQGRNFSGGTAPALRSPHLHLNYFSRQWFLAEADDLLPQTQFFGGVLPPPQTAPPAWLTAIPSSVPLAFITLGSVFTGDLGFFAWAAQAAARVGLLPVIALGRNPITPEQKAELKAALPPQTRLLNWVPYEHVLPRTKLIIQHGGLGTTHAALLHGIPQLVVPHAADQRENAQRVAQAKLGLNLTAHDVRHGALAEGARALAQDERVQANARQWAQDFAALGGAPAAADALIAYLKG